MSLRTRLILVFGALMGLLVGAEWALVTALTRDLEREVAEVAYKTGTQVLRSVFPEMEEIESDPHERMHFGREHVRAFMVTRPDELEFHEVMGPVHDELISGRGLHFFEEEFVRRLEGVPLSDGLPRGRSDGHHRLVMALTEQVWDHTHPRQGRGEFGVVLQISSKRGAPKIGVDFEIVEEEEHVARFRPREPMDAAPVAVTPTSEDEPVSVEIPIASEGIEAANQRWLRRLMAGSGAILGLGLLVAGWLAHQVTRPLRDLTHAAREVGDGAFGTQAPTGGDREVGEAIGAFNHMSHRLAQLDAEAKDLREREHLTEIGEMARGLAHAMRNPLHLLGLSVEQLASKSQGADDLAASARGQILRIDRSLRTFLALSTHGAGALEDVRVEDLARDVALELMQEGTGGPRIEVNADPGCVLRGVSAELRAVLHVLVVNAVEATPAEGDPVEVRITCGEEVVFEVLDRGAGLADEVKGKLFTPHLTTKEQGAGMGLFLAKRIASSRYGGRLELRDREGGGAVAELTLRDREDIGA